MSRGRVLVPVIYAAAMGLELCCLYIGLALLQKHIGLGFGSLVLILLIYPLSLLSRLAAVRMNVSRQYIVAAIGLGIAIVAAIAALAVREMLIAGYPAAGAIIQIILCGLAWWLGSTLARPETDYRYICFRFQTAMLVLLVLALAEGSTFLPIMLFFVLATFALTLTRWESSLTGSTGILQPLRARHIIMGSTAVLLPAAAIFLALSPNIARDILQWLSSPLSFFASLLSPPPITTGGKPIIINLSCSFQPSDEGTAMPATPPAGAASPEVTSPVVFWLIILAVFVAVVLLIFLAVKKIRAQRQDGQPAHITGVETSTITVSLFAGLAGLPDRIVKWLWHLLLSVKRLITGRRLQTANGYEAAVSVRAIYRGLLLWAAKHALPREQAQTPSEYLGSLSRKFPQQGAEMQAITEIYVQARYGHSPTPSEALEAAAKAWQRIKSAP
ncbi:MAG: DUF4129 domain-containing protein [Chloroflexota bacterium]